jgi:hypothetical protein
MKIGAEAMVGLTPIENGDQKMGKSQKKRQKIRKK